MFQAKIVEHTVTNQNCEHVTLTCVFPRFILAEVNTHSMFARNSASSRAIPTRKLLKQVIKNPFIPIAWQKEHTGMQGKLYFENDVEYDLSELASEMKNHFQKILNLDKESDSDFNELAMDYFKKAFIGTFDKPKYTLKDFWLKARDRVVEIVTLLLSLGVTKQICNRLLEPFMYHSCVITTEVSALMNFFKQRLPEYNIKNEEGEITIFNSKLYYAEVMSIGGTELKKPVKNDLEWLKINTGSTEIHMSLLAEHIYDAYRKSKPRKLLPGFWHIPFNNDINIINVRDYIKTHYLKNMETITAYEAVMFESFICAKIGTVMCARFSYTTIDSDETYSIEKQMELFDKMFKDIHRSPFEHAGLGMSSTEMISYVRGKIDDITEEGYHTDAENIGWCGKMRGLIPMRYQMERKIKMFKTNESIS